MRLLVLGGTAWLSGLIASTALARGHEVTCLARGSAPVPDGTHLVTADRDRPDAYAEVVSQRWDTVFDVARQPGHVRRSVDALAEVADRYVFVSSANVYADHSEIGQDESAELLAPLQSDVMESMETYGEAKVACEQAVLAGFGEARSLLARAGLIGGPGDGSGRSGYWPWRFARPSNPEAAVLVPNDPDFPAALIDARDLAEWLVRCAEDGTAGPFNVGGDAVPLREHLAAVREVTGHRGPVLGAPLDWLADHGVQEWAGPRSLPLWIADTGWRGMNARDVSRARAAGLRTRPLTETLADTLEWELGREQPGPHGAGLTDAEELELLGALGDAARPWD